jgi:hypothetical protein
MAYLSDVKVRSDRFAVGQHNAQVLLWVGFQQA